MMLNGRQPKRLTAKNRGRRGRSAPSVRDYSDDPAGNRGHRRFIHQFRRLDVGGDGFCQPVAVDGHAQAYFGATLIPVSALLDPSGRWLNTKLKVPQCSAGQFKGGIALWRVLIELLLCRRSSWLPDSDARDQEPLQAFRRLSIGASGIEEGTWRELQASAEQYLPPDEVADNDDA